MVLSKKHPVLDPFRDINPIMETLSLPCMIPEQLDSSRNVTYTSKLEDDSERELEGDSGNDFDNVF